MNFYKKEKTHIFRSKKNVIIRNFIITILDSL